MPGIATGETFSFAEGKLYLYASASGTTSGSGVGFLQGTTITCVYGWDETITCDGRYENVITGRMITLQANALRLDLGIRRCHQSRIVLHVRACVDSDRRIKKWRAMSEPININTLDQLNDIIVSVELPLPDGGLGVVKMRPLSAKRVREIRRSITWPTPPLKDFKKDGGAVNPVYDLQDKNYIHAEEDANLELASRTLDVILILQ